jgi:hypothetical protein
VAAKLTPIAVAIAISAGFANQRAIVREYFDETIRRRPSALLAGRSRFQEVSITRMSR